MPSERDLAFMCVKYRKDNHLSQEECAKQMHISITTLCKMEKEEEITKRVFLIIYEFLKEKGVEL